MNQTFQSEVEFLRAHGLNPIVLGNDEGARLVTLAEYQGRVMTSTMAGDGGAGCGWINRALIASGKRMPHINAYGGEDRFWLGPEGGQFSLYFPPGAPFDFDHWQVPAAEDTDVWKLDSAGATEAAFSTEFSIRNWSGFEKMIRMERLVRLLDCAGIAADLGVAFDKTRVSAVGYVTENRVTNIGPEAWTRENGALSIWMLGMFNPSARTVIVIPYRTDAPGAIVKDDYFGRIPADRLRIDSGSSRILFSADGNWRSKLGLTNRRATGVLGSYDAENRILTVVRYSAGAADAEYVNAAWELQERPFEGDTVNAYNDGPLADGSRMGPFYELESSSPAGFPAPGGSFLHTHATFHFTGEPGELDWIAEKLLNGPVTSLTL